MDTAFEFGLHKNAVIMCSMSEVISELIVNYHSSIYLFPGVSLCMIG